MDPELSEAQRAVLDESVRLVEACPGAGKTRAMVSRFIAVSTSSPRAIALVSFTNAAVDEAARRCVNNPEATQPPNFIGTFDRFIHRYIVTPVIVRERLRPSRYVDTWNDLPHANFNIMVRHRDVRGGGLALANFHPDLLGRLHYPTDIPAGDRAYVSQLENSGYTPNDLTDLAERMVNNLLNAGIYDSESSRLESLAILRDPSYAWLHERIAARFEEVIVDEFQDCSAIEHAILSELRSLEIRVVAVADPDQAIYEFRQATPSAYVDYRNRLMPGQIAYLDENWRSSPAICKLLSSLRSISARPILSRRDPNESPHAEAVYVAVGTPHFARAEFVRLATNLDILGNERLVLAATRAAAIGLSGRPPSTGAATKISSSVIRHVGTLRFSVDASERKAAITAIESIILGTIRFGEDLKTASRQDLLDAADIDQSRLRMMVARLIEASRSWSSAQCAVASIRETMAELLSDIRLGHTSMGHRFRSADLADWKAWQRSEAAATEEPVELAAHIHSVKGAERDAVLLDIEDEPKGSRAHVIELWAAGDTHEARRVLYVGASRARRLLVLAVAPEHHGALQAVLDRSEAVVEYIVEHG